MTLKKKSSKAKSKTTAKKTITDKKLGEILTETLNQAAEEPQDKAPAEIIAEQIKETPKEQSKQNKIEKMVQMLLTSEGVTLKELAEKLSWLENSVRGSMSVYTKKHPEYKLTSEKVDGVRYYRLTKNGD